MCIIGGSGNIAGGIIYGADAPAELRNIASSGAALWIQNGGVAEYGFGNPLPDYSENTIRIENGVLMPYP